MKTLRFISALALVLFAFISSCKKDGSADATNTSTNNSNALFSAIIDGKLFETNEITDATSNGYEVGIIAKSGNAAFIIEITKPKAGSTYTSDTTFFVQYYPNILVDSSFIGIDASSISISSFDINQRRISGNFQLTMKNYRTNKSIAVASGQLKAIPFKYYGGNFTCKVDGQAYNFPYLNTGGDIVHADSSKSTELTYFYSTRPENTYPSIDVSLQKNIPVGTYNFKADEPYFDALVRYSKSDIDKYTGSGKKNTGTLTIIQNDTLNGYVEGKFSIEVENNAQTIKHITNADFSFYYKK